MQNPWCRALTAPVKVKISYLCWNCCGSFCFSSRKPVHVAGGTEAMTTDNLDRLKARRRGHRGVATKYVQEARALVTGESRDELVIARIKSLQSLLEEKLEVLKRLNEEILQASPTEAIEGEIVRRTLKSLLLLVSDADL